MLSGPHSNNCRVKTPAFKSKGKFIYNRPGMARGGVEV